MYVAFPFSKRRFQMHPGVITMPAKPVSKAERIADEIVFLIEHNGAEGHEGSPVSLHSHLVQCAMLAMEHLSDLPVILGALLHDVGCLVNGEHPAEATGRIEGKNKAERGAFYLRSNGFTDRVCALVETQATARRYLATTDTNYRAMLLPASLEAVHEKGGRMTETEVAAFEQHPYFTDIIKIARWDVEAKNKQAVLVPLSFFRRLIWDHLSLRMQ